jgi:hypothetical protein
MCAGEVVTAAESSRMIGSSDFLRAESAESSFAAKAGAPESPEATTAASRTPLESSIAANPRKDCRQLIRRARNMSDLI